MSPKGPRYTVCSTAPLPVDEFKRPGPQTPADLAIISQYRGFSLQGPGLRRFCRTTQVQPRFSHARGVLWLTSNMNRLRAWGVQHARVKQSPLCSRPYAASRWHVHPRAIFRAAFRLGPDGVAMYDNSTYAASRNAAAAGANRVPKRST